jgi:hypothetical protein
VITQLNSAGTWRCSRLASSKSSRRNRRAIAALAILYVCDATAQTTPSTFQIHWDDPYPCIPTRQFEEKLRVLLGTEPEGVLSTALSVTAVVRQTVLGQWQIELSFTEQEETRIRRLSAQSCTELTDAAALLVALAVDPNMEARLTKVQADDAPFSSATETAPASIARGDASIAQSQSKAPDKPGEPMSMLRVREPSTPTAATRSWARFHPFFGLGPATSFGVLPGIGLGGQAVGGFQSRHLRLSLEASLLASRSASLPGAAEARADLYSWTIGFAPCWLVSFGKSVSLGPCAMAELGMLGGHGQGLEGTRSAQKPWGALRLGGHGALQVSQYARLVFAGDLGAPFGRASFLLAGEQVHQPNSTVGGLRILAEMHFQ